MCFLNNSFSHIARILFISILISCTNQLHSQVWKKKNDFPGQARRGAVCFNVNDRIFFGTGSNGSTLLLDFWEYNTSNDTWTQKSNFMGSGRRAACAFSIGAYGYVGTGWTGSISYFDFYRYDPSADTWKQVATYPGGGGRNSYGVSANGKGYVGGGAYNIFSPYNDDFYEYNPSTDKWTQKANLPFGDRTGGIAFSLGNKVYLGLGHNNIVDYNDLWEYNPQTNTWKQVASLPGPGRLQARVFLYKGKAIVGGGYRLGGGGNSTLSDYYSYNPSTNSWTQISSYASGAKSIFNAFEVKDKGYHATGWNKNRIDMAEVWEYSDTSCLVLSEIWDTTCVEYRNPSNTMTYTQSGTYYDTLISKSGCDSAITIHLQIMTLVLSEIYDTSCVNYRNPSNTMTYTESGTYYDTLKSKAGCDSAITIHLHIISFEYDVQRENDTLYVYGDSLSYQWINCNNGLPVPGADSNLFYSQVNGLYAVIVSNGYCKDKSMCYEYSFGCQLYIPNSFTPNDDDLNEYFGPNLTCIPSKYEFIIFNRWGDKLFESDNPNLKWDGYFNNELCPNGIYVYRLNFEFEGEKKEELSGKIGLIH